jgi:CheY-like chemotaxis protein
VVTATGKKILIVDDSVIILEAASDALVKVGHTVVTAETPAELLERATEHGDFDLVLMDVQMPELFGDDIATVLRDRGMRGKIYLFSSLPVKELATRAHDSKLDGYISKDIGLDAMVKRVGEILTSA